VQDRDGRFETRNSSLAAYLYMEGFDLLDVNIRNFPSIFIFVDSASLQECVHKFQVAKAEGNLVLYYNAYRRCLKMARRGKQ